VLGLLAAVGMIASAHAVDGQDPTPGSQKFPDAIFDLYRVEVGYEGSVYSQSYTYGVGAKGLTRQKCERATDADPWTCLEAEESTSYYITSLDGREGGDQLFIAGLNDDGSCVIERWDYPGRKHGWHVSVSVPPGAGIGTSLPPVAPALAVSGGGDWQPPSSSAQSLPSASRTVIYTTQLGPIHGMDVDPQGRYLLFYDMSLETLFRLDLTQEPPAPTAIAQASSHSQLDQVGALDLMDFPGEGRKCLIRRELTSNFRRSQEVYTLLGDANNDGIFEDVTVLDSDAWDASTYSDWTLWNQYWYE
jgi:hypothetical protein